MRTTRYPKDTTFCHRHSKQTRLSSLLLALQIFAKICIDFGGVWLVTGEKVSELIFLTAFQF